MPGLHRLRPPPPRFEQISAARFLRSSARFSPPSILSSARRARDGRAPCQSLGIPSRDRPPTRLQASGSLYPARGERVRRYGSPLVAFHRESVAARAVRS